MKVHIVIYSNSDASDLIQHVFTSQRAAHKKCEEMRKRVDDPCNVCVMSYFVSYFVETEGKRK